MGQIETRHLRLVEAIVEEGGMTRAVTRLHLSQSALSVQLRDLESRLGVSLFDRRNRRLVPTAAAQRLMEAARKVLPELDSAEADARALAGAPITWIRIATECYTCYHWFARAFARVRSRFPDVQAHFVVEATRRPLPALLAGNLDLAVAVNPPKRKDLVAYPLFNDELVLLVPPRHPLAGRSHVDARDFVGQSLLTYDCPPEELDLFTRVLNPARVVPARVSKVQLTEAILEMVKAGAGIAVQARWVAAPDISAGRLKGIRVTRAGLKRKWSAVVARRSQSIVHDFTRELAASISAE